MSNTKAQKLVINWGQRPLTIETGALAHQADGSALVRYGDTVALATATVDRSKTTETDFVPLSVHYTEKYFAAGRIPGGYGKREGRPSEKEVLVSRLIDRPLRPLINSSFRFETQVLVTVLSFDPEVDSDIVGMIAASTALSLAGVPFNGPLTAAKVALIDNDFVINPTKSQLAKSRLDLTIAGTANAINMVESEADELSEEIMLKALIFAHREIQPVISAINDLIKVAGTPCTDIAQKIDDSELLTKAQNIIGDKIKQSLRIAEKKSRRAALNNCSDIIKTALVEDGSDEATIKSVTKKLVYQTLRDMTINDGIRAGGRDYDNIRDISCETGLLPRAHGSSLFNRGETQVLAVTTLGTDDDAVHIDALEGNYRDRFMLHYNFPPSSVGEVGKVGATGRREIGHGNLARKALRRMMPDNTSFPYSVRVVAEVLACNGSSSMGTVCASTLALLDAGVPLKRPVAGIAMGLLKDHDKHVVLTDILGDEDALGDMDFKVAGTEQGITAMQMDIKISGITENIFTEVLQKAKTGRLKILSIMNEALGIPREQSSYAPQIVSIKIPVDKIREIIGAGGKVIREITEFSGAKIDISDDGTIKISAVGEEAINKAKQRIAAIASEPEVGQIYSGKVVKIADFGAFVNFFGSRDGLVHVSQMAEHRVEKPSDIVKEGEVVQVKFVGLDDRGKFKLTMRGLK